MKLIDCWPEETVDILIGLRQEDEFKLKPLEGGKVLITYSKRREHAGDGVQRLHGPDYRNWGAGVQESMCGTCASADDDRGGVDDRGPHQGQPQ